jgi:hypothetical protein
MKKIQINEGLIEHDLDDLVLPLISIDEFESKIDDNAIVLAFFVKDLDPANDLNHFIQKGSIEILDSDVSPAPDENGYYLVFVELLRQPKTIQTIIDLVDSFSNLTNVKSWTIKAYKKEKTLPLNSENLKKMVNFNKQDFHKKIEEFFVATELDNLLLENSYAKLFRRNNFMVIDIIDMDTLDNIYVRHNIYEQPMRFDSRSLNNCSLIENYLGEGWTVQQYRDKFVVISPNHSHALLTKIVED